MASDNSGGKTIGLFVLGALAFILGIFAYSQTSARNAAVAAADVAQAQMTEAKSATATSVADTGALKDKLGIDGEVIGGQAPGPDTVLGKLNATIDQYGGAQAGDTVVATLQAMRTEIQRLTAESTAERAAKDELALELNKVRGDTQNRITEYEVATRDAKSEVNSIVSETDARLQEKDAEITRANSALESAVARAEEGRRTAADTIEEKDQVIENYEKRIDLLGKELSDKDNYSFERADGTVVRVDPRQRLVYLDLGSADGLPTETTFSVYRKNNAGIGRGLEDVKGAIEVIRILRPHLAEARITDDSLDDPIGSGDLLYSPLWQSGQKNYFSFVGTLNIDGDGQEDRQLLFSKIRDEGGEVELFVDEQGRRHDGDGDLNPDARLSSKTKFLVLGEIPNPGDYATNQPEFEWAGEILQRRQELEKEARQQGIRIVNLPDFVSYLGYKPTQRLFRPGDERSVDALRTR